ncbi:unnamed protein product [Thelazia callipaeda]|uniref:F-box domain-containing protein n=1 Tax=Thelazia callipaeda TaxID=103827 RepID=A0A0N5CT61_THECL|nr:unnamed protein product [Thelazia callipaeda]
MESEQGQASQITNFFAVRKRKSSEQQSSLLRGKKSRANQNQDAEDNFSDQVVPDISLVDNKENGDFSASDSSSASSCDEYTFSSAWRNAIQLIPNVTVSTPRGIFEMLPPELLCEAFNYIPASQLIKLSLSSATLNIQIQEYVKLSSVHRRFREEISTKHKVLYKPDHDPFYDWG